MESTMTLKYKEEFFLLCTSLFRFQQGEKKTIVTEDKTYIQNKSCYFNRENNEKLWWREEKTGSGEGGMRNEYRKRSMLAANS